MSLIICSIQIDLFYCMYAHLGESIVFEIQVCAELTAGRTFIMNLVAQAQTLRERIQADVASLSLSTK